MVSTFTSVCWRSFRNGLAKGADRLGLIRNGDRIRIDIPNRRIDVLLSDEELAARRAEQDAKGWKPVLPRPRKVSAALLATSADKGAIQLSAVAGRAG